jgi:uncharacterized Tic20 family protein
MATDNDHDFDEEEWKASGADGPSFEFEEKTGEPEFTPRDEADDEPELGAHEREWQRAEADFSEERFEEASRKSARMGYGPREADARTPGFPDPEERQWAMIGHAAGAVSVLATGGTAGWLVPLVIWLIRRDEGGFAAEQAKEALNFQLTTFLLSLIAIPLMCIGVGVLIVLAIPIASVVFSIIGAVRTWGGERYDYPINFRLI